MYIKWQIVCDADYEQR